MLKHVSIGILVVLAWLVIVRAAWIGLRDPERAQDWLDDNLPTATGWYKLLANSPDRLLWWIRGECLLVLGMMLFLGFEGVLWAYSQLRP